MVMSAQTKSILALMLVLAVTVKAEETSDNPDALAKRVRDALLDQFSPVVVDVSTHGITTLQFPAHIDALDGDGFASKAGQEAQFLIAPGESCVSIKSLVPGAEQNLNVVIHGRVYPIVIRTRDKNDYAVIFHEPSMGPMPKTSLAQVKREVPRKKISTARIIGL